VTATGPASAMGRIAAMLVTAPGMTPLQRRLAGVGRMLALLDDRKLEGREETTR